MDISERAPILAGYTAFSWVLLRGLRCRDKSYGKVQYFSLHYLLHIAIAARVYANKLWVKHIYRETNLYSISALLFKRALSIR